MKETLAVRVDFEAGRVLPRLVRRAGRLERVASVNHQWVDRAGDDPKLCLSVTMETGDDYLISLSVRDLLWRLDDVSCF